MPQLFPEHKGGIWGPTEDIVKYKIKITEPKSSLIVSTDGTGTIGIQMDHPISIEHKLTTLANESYTKTESSVYADLDGNNVKFHLRIQDAGQYKMEIYCGEEESPPVDSVAAFLIQVKEGWQGDCFPPHAKLWGLTAAGRKLGITVPHPYYIPLGFYRTISRCHL